MIGIVGWGCYIPRLRLTGEVFASQWGGPNKGSRSLANFDEDTVTMAAEAALECLEGHDPMEVDRLYFATTTPPYMEHQNAAIISAVADLRTDTLSADFCGSVRSGTTAMRAAHDAVKASEAENVMVCASDLRLATPGDPMERTVGDAAGAFIIGRDRPVAVFSRFFSSSKLFLDRWRREGERFVNYGDAKFINDEGILNHLPSIVNDLFDGMDLARDEVDKVVYYSPDLRLRKGLDKKLGFGDGSYDSNLLQSELGDTGCAQVFLGLLDALEKAEPGEKILLVNYGSGADAVLLDVTAHIERFQCSLHEQMEVSAPVSSYGRYLKFRGLVPGEDLNIWTSFPVLWREEKQNVRRLGKKCLSCGMVNFPPRPECKSCGGEELETVKISRKGEVFTFTLDSLVPNPEPPTPMVSVDLDGGGRLYAQMTDVDPGTVEIGTKVEMVFRKLHEGGDFNHYFWKFRPALEE